MADPEHREHRARAPLAASLRAGITARQEVLLTDRHLTFHVGGRGVFATPAMIWLLEDLAHNSVATHLGPEQTTVGYEVHVFHRAPAELGDRIVIESRLVEVERNRLTFEVRASKGDLVLGDGIHRRAVVTART